MMEKPNNLLEEIQRFLDSDENKPSRTTREIANHVGLDLAQTLKILIDANDRFILVFEENYDPSIGPAFVTKNGFKKMQTPQPRFKLQTGQSTPDLATQDDDPFASVVTDVYAIKSSLDHVILWAGPILHGVDPDYVDSLQKAASTITKLLAKILSDNEIQPGTVIGSLQ